MIYLIINSHPYSGSFNAGVAETIKQTAEMKGHSVVEVNLVTDNFNPVMTAEDLKAWGKGRSVDPLVRKYQDEIDHADVLVFPFPVWWGYLPAVLKGFCDKVLLPGWAYKYGDNGEIIGLLTLKKALVITTMQTPAELFENYFRNPVNGAFIMDTLQTCGIDVIGHKQIDGIVSGGRAYTENMMAEIKELIQ